MKITITEFRDMVAQAVRRTVREARKPKEVAPRSEESVLAQRDRQVRALPGYTHADVLDMSKPLGKRSRTKKQGAANMGGWTSESRGGRVLGRPTPRGPAAPKPAPQGQEEPAFSPSQPDGHVGNPDASRLMDILTKNGVPFDRAQRIASEFGRETQAEAVRRLVRMIVREEISVRR
jgi:hypothetical protein